MTSCLPGEKGSGWLLFYLVGICPRLLLRASAREWITRMNLGRLCRQGQDWRGEGRKEMHQQEELQESGDSFLPQQGMLKWLSGILLGKRK